MAKLTMFPEANKNPNVNNDVINARINSATVGSVRASPNFSNKGAIPKLRAASNAYRISLLIFYLN